VFNQGLQTGPVINWSSIVIVNLAFVSLQGNTLDSAPSRFQPVVNSDSMITWKNVRDHSAVAMRKGTGREIPVSRIESCSVQELSLEFPPGKGVLGESLKSASFDPG
jgi:hypothetical protein